MREADYDAYDLDDPKHPDWEDRAAERADLERKREKEDAALPEADRQRILLAPERSQGFPLSRAERQPVSKRGRRWLILFALIAFIVGMFVIVEQARARPPVPPDVFVAVRAHWQERQDRVKAFDVIWCESRYDTEAVNGEHLGLFQAGEWFRGRFGHGSSARAQARAAHRGWLVFGWSRSQWSCA